MRLIARFPDHTQVGSLIDTLKNAGFSRKDMIVSDLEDRMNWDSVDKAAEEAVFIKTETEGLGEIKPFGEGISGLEGKRGIIVAVELPKHNSDRVREMMEQSGAVEIIQD